MISNLSKVSERPFAGETAPDGFRVGPVVSQTMTVYKPGSTSGDSRLVGHGPVQTANKRVQ